MAIRARRLALAAAMDLMRSRPTEARSLMAEANRAARRLEREGMPCPAAYARVIQGALAALRGNPARSVLLLEEAAVRFEAVDMRPKDARERMIAIREQVAGSDVRQWATRFLAELGVV